ncbi:MAG: DNA-binding protein WhiA [Solobacterium sp.]|nr:DNA-binding protein WhiA [Solobacterium sp.]
MSFATDVKQEVALKEMEGNDARAELSALLQMTSSLSLSSRGMAIAVTVENASVARVITRLVKDRYGAEIELYVKRKMNLKKNRVYGIRIVTNAKEILEDTGLYSKRGLLDRPLKKIVQSDSNARAYLAGAFLASGSINPPEKTNYHLEITAAADAQAELLQELMARYGIKAKIIERRNRKIVYVKAAERIADFLRIIEASQAVLKYENIRISRDFTNQIVRLNNMDVANEIKTQAASAKQLEDIRILEENDRIRFLDQKLLDVVRLRKENPYASLKELQAIYEKETGTAVSKSGMKHRFDKLRELAEKVSAQ